jgi:hypothetical protein
MAKAKDKSSTQWKELPLDSPDWISVEGEAYRRLCSKTGSPGLAAKDLTDRMANESVPSMRRCFMYGIRREKTEWPDREPLHGQYWTKHRLSPRADGSAEVIEGVGSITSVKGFAHFAWKPALAKIWPDVFASTPSPPVLTSPSPAPTEPPAAERELLGHARRGPKPYDWELYKAKFYLLLDNDDVPAHGEINISDYAGRLMTWGNNNLEEGETPGDAAMRGKVKDWVPLWRRLKSLNK